MSKEEVMSTIASLLAMLEASIIQADALREQAGEERLRLLWPFLGVAAIDLKKVRLTILEGLEAEEKVNGKVG